MTKLKSALLLTAFLVCELTSNGQNVRLCYDTINVVTIAQFDQGTKSTFAVTRYFYMTGKYYYANNFPFDHFKSNGKFPKSDRMYYTDYMEIINHSSIKHLRSGLNSSQFYDYDDTSHVFSPEVSAIISCIGKGMGAHLVISELKIIAAYFIIDCGTFTGVHDAIYCDQKVDLLKTPVILNVLKFLK
jgi:hypothetical protein